MNHGAASFVVLMVVTVVVAAVAAAGVTAGEVPLVDPKDGSVTGIIEESVKGRNFYSFYGIPFARPPVGKLRFKDPEPPLAWKDVRDASVPAPPCLQLSFVAQLAGKIEVLGEEDCLYLNVFTPTIQEDRVLPVMVWIHGGGFFSSGAEEYLPHVLLDQDVVLVVIQYRLSVLGFLSTEDSVLPGNLGLKDQTMALEWVQRNIDVFGGDKTRVTIFGESAGGASVHFQLLTPKAEGLFSRAILQSGTALCPWALSNTPRIAALQVADAVGCSTDQGSESLLECLQAVDASAFLPLLADIRDWYIFPSIMNPWVDGHYLPDHPAQLMREGRHAKVDIISGINRDDGAIFTLPALGVKQLMEELQQNFNVAAPASLEFEMTEDPVAVTRHMYLHYMGTTEVDETQAEGLKNMFHDRHFSVCHDQTTAYHALHLHPSKKTFRYELQHIAELSITQLLCPFCGYDWVCHADDLYYLFRGGTMLTPPIAPPERPKDLRLPDDLALRDIITTLWTNFAATGNPTSNASMGFTWEPSTADNLQYLSLTPSPSMQPDSRKEIRRFHSSLPTQENVIFHPYLV